MSLSAAQREHYWAKGWVVAEGVFGRDEADRVGEVLLALAGRERESGKEGYNLDISEDGERAPRKINEPFAKDAVCREMLLDARLTSRMEQLLGHQPLLVVDQAFLKPPRFGSAKPYHQDNFYFRCHPDDEVITAWLALDDVDEQNGCLRYIDGSHLGPIIPHEQVAGEEYNHVPPPELIDLSKESPARVRKGGVVFHHSKALHTSHRNSSDRWRKGWATHWVTANVTCEKETLDRAYFRRPELREVFTS
ncbi:MAG TPA: phytanoyl-CoA dioxygenase family protein [Bryobacterales bacterium]|nr:phytanoyl-CoA dioxygenase family protein [Bryobacterales bacterium]